MPSLEELIGQMLLVGFRGTQLNADSPIVQHIKKYNIGGIILFDYDVPTCSRPRNIESPIQLQKLTSDLQDAAATPLFIGIDQEGGVVNRLKKDYGFPASFSHAEIGKMDDSEALRAADEIAHVLQTCHINLNFAPCVDVAVNPDNPVIAQKQRSFSINSETVAKKAELYIQAHHQHSIMCAIKHFPGHGSSLADTHHGMADITETWLQTELYPFQYLIEKDLPDMVMSAHVFHKNFDNLPASLSFKIIHELLREKLNWQGVCITDDLQMGAITQHFGFEKSLELAIHAGIDILLLGNNLVWNENLIEQTITVMCDLVKQKRIPLQRIEQAYERIQHLKQRWCKNA